ncbi:nucleotidyltransferase domain-containing protein [Candidatus Micrarchaeota archaeon]|nr:nucleotidyltransferase domain-containing protein [Candidatus Micrarchaeota archaeon]
MDEKLSALLKDIRLLFSDAKIYLFGSRAKGTAKAQSDYDLIIISQKFKATPFVNRGGLIWRHTDVPIVADLLCYTPDEFQKVSKTSVIIKDVLQHATPL